jgi:phosphoglycerol geranylgeranyltransferase
MEVMNTILSARAAGKKLLAVLLDPEKPFHPELFAQALPDLIFVGGSTGTNAEKLVHTLKSLNLKSSILNLKSSIPIILFPGNISQFTPEADALLFLSVLSSSNPDMLTGAHIRAARAVKQSGIESIPMGYILIDGGRESAVERTTGSAPIARTDIDRIVNTAIAAQLLGKQLVYLEAGSGAAVPVAPETISAVRKHLSIPLIVGGGICTPEQMKAAFAAGADIVVIGNHFESHPTDLPLFLQAQPVLQSPCDGLTAPAVLQHSGHAVSTDDVRYMTLALNEARKAAERDEVPVGCIIVADGQIVGRGHNLTETLADVTAHAEMQALTAAAQTLGGKYLSGCTAYVTMEPCSMCAAALGWAQLSRLVYGASDPKRGYTIYAPNALHPKTQVTAGVMADECSRLVQDFFHKKRL